MPVSLGEAVRLARRRAGLSQLQLAEKAGVSRNTVVALETNGEECTLNSLRLVAEALGALVEVRFMPFS